MKKILWLGLLSMCVMTYSAKAQRKVSGTVTDNTGETVPGVNILLKNTSTGVTSDLDGKYSISVPDDGGILVFSFIGLTTKEVEIGAQSVIDVAMEADVQKLTEVVVTGLGIVKEKKALGYGVSEIGSDALAARQESDVARLLRGKATGVNISSTSGLAGSGTNVIIRGYSSITGSNQPLFVVDGIPFNTDQNTGNQDFTSGSATASSRFLDLDPNNIADISILKGLSATVLYGEAGRNGVVLVTTKNGKGGADANKKMEITVSQGVYQTEIANLPDYQNTYGNGFSGGFGWYFSNWGAAFDDTNESSYGSDYKGLTDDGQVLITHPYDQEQYWDDFPEYIDADYVYKPYKSVENFFKKGLSSNTSVSIASKLGDNASVSASYSYLTEEGFTPKLDAMRGSGRSNYYDKHNLGLGAQAKLTNGLKVKGTFNYVNSDRLTPITAPAFGGDGNGLFAAILFTPRSMDLMNLPYQSPIDGSNVYYRRGSTIQNPRWTLNNSGQSEQVNRFFSSTELSYELSKHLSLLYRLSLDRYDQTNNRHINKGGSQVPLGVLQTYDITSGITDQIANLIYNYDLGPKFQLDGLIGANSRRQVKGETGTLSSNQFIYNLLTHDNFIDHTAYTYNSEENTLGVYGTATLTYNYYLFLMVQARNDWTSTLEKSNRSVFYPSASLSFIPTDAIPALDNNPVVDYLKVRVSYGTSAGYPNPYRTRSVLLSTTNAFVDSDGNVINKNSVDDFVGNANLKPELFKEYEAGIEAKFWDGRIGLDLSLYHKKSSDLIIDLAMDPATSYTETTVNAAQVVNKGIELGLDIHPIRGEFQWDITLNYTKNISKVESIYSGIDNFVFSGYSTLGNAAVAGQAYGALWGYPFLKNDEGKIIVDSQGSYRTASELGVIGDPNPDFIASWMNNLSWKGLSFGFQIQYTKGGDMFSSTVQSLLARGNTTDTDVDRYIPVVLPNSVKVVGTDEDGNDIYEENDIQTYMGDTFFDAYFGADEGGVFDATVIRLREVSLAYALPSALLEKTPFGRVAVTLSGQNLWYYAPNFPKGINFDPEVSSTGVGNGQGFDYRTAPTAKKYGVTLTATF